MDPGKVFLKTWSDSGGPDWGGWNEGRPRPGRELTLQQFRCQIFVEEWPEMGLWDKEEQADARDIAKKNNQYLDMAKFREGEVRTTQIRCPLYLACQNLVSEVK